jgi:hypothetical protein
LKYFQKTFVSPIVSREGTSAGKDLVPQFAEDHCGVWVTHCIIKAVRRVSAIFVLMSIWFSLIASVALASSTSNLPQCCLRGGKHHCAMPHPSSDGLGISALQQKCPLYPVAPGHTALNHAALGVSWRSYNHTLPSQQACTSRTQAAGFGIVLNSEKKRGPPTPLS